MASHHLRKAIVVSALCAMLGGLLWAAAIAASWLTDCPGLGDLAQPTGLDKGISLWPPGADCTGSDAAPFEAWKFAPAVIVAFFSLAILVVVLGAVAARRRAVSET